MILLPIHIIAGVIGIGSGFVALSTLKGAKLHRKSGMVFVYAMLVVAITGTVMGAFISEMAAVIPGLLTFYLVLTSLLTVRRPASLKFPWVDLGALLVALTTGLGSLLYGLVAEGQPTALYIVFGLVALLAALGDIRVIRSRGIQGARRIARHLWRMCIALLLAAISFFIGQTQVFPEPLRNSGLLPIPVLLVFLAMLYWLVRVLFTQWYQREYLQVPAGVPGSLRGAAGRGSSADKEQDNPPSD
jgi:hypothetical protein